jgi:hypothetical protein
MDDQIVKVPSISAMLRLDPYIDKQGVVISIPDVVYEKKVFW